MGGLLCILTALPVIFGVIKGLRTGGQSAQSSERKFGYKVALKALAKLGNYLHKLRVERGRRQRKNEKGERAYRRASAFVAPGPAATAKALTGGARSCRRLFPSGPGRVLPARRGV